MWCGDDEGALTGSCWRVGDEAAPMDAGCMRMMRRRCYETVGKGMMMGPTCVVMLKGC